MTTFLNFAPLQFMGGAERWVFFVARHLSTQHEVNVICMQPSIASLYAQAVLKRRFTFRTTQFAPPFAYSSISPAAFFPWTASGKKLRATIAHSDTIYAKFELNEVLLLLLFGGLRALRKTVFGLHSPLFYEHDNLSVIEKLHNSIYRQPWMKSMLSSARAIHVLSLQQAQVLQDELGITNYVCIPNFIATKPKLSEGAQSTSLKAIFVGELSERKGAHILLQLIRLQPNDVSFEIFGDGPLFNELKAAAGRNVVVHGYEQQEVIDQALQNSDVLFMPSRAEGLSIAMLHALSHGLPIVTSPFIRSDELQAYTLPAKNDDPDEYLSIFAHLHQLKTEGTLRKMRKAHWQNANEQFSKRTHLASLEKLLTTT